MPHALAAAACIFCLALIIVGDSGYSRSVTLIAATVASVVIGRALWRQWR